MEYEEFDNAIETKARIQSEYENEKQRVMYCLGNGPLNLRLLFRGGYTSPIDELTQDVIEELTKKGIVEIKEIENEEVIGLTKEYREKNKIKTGW